VSIEDDWAKLAGGMANALMAIKDGNEILYKTGLFGFAFDWFNMTPPKFGILKK
jgi:hypothetical protein